MRKVQKNQILDIIKTIYEAHELIKKHLKDNNTEIVLNILAECQNAAINIGENIEKAEGEGFITVKYLEDYCEQLYNISLILNDDDISAGNIAKKLDKCIIKVENSVKTDINIKYEIVFMPYKASMWDSMESVWQAADKDPNCDAYVVPIPYYDRNKDLSLGTYHYEGLQFPSYVPIVSSYDFEKRRPDVIYIHNPYDDANFITSVDPKYYSDKLIQYTECLVYIPYYSTSGGMAKSQYSFKSYDNVNYIVAQSKNLIKYFDNNLPKTKFLALGSPKFDRIINMSKKSLTAPFDWQMKMIGKKVYFYNTSLTGMLEDTSKFLKKMQYVFKCFAGREDSCLLWRPHPLLESTFESMRPQYLDMYRKLKQFFIDRNLGIYDDTPDMEKAIVLSDAYIGDLGSSVVSVFSMVGKPIFSLDNSIDTTPSHKDKISSLVSGFDIYSDSKYQILWGSHLFYSENNDYNYKYLCCLSNENWDYLSTVIDIDNKIYIRPINNQYITFLENGELKKIKLKQTDDKLQSFLYMFNVGKYIILIPNKYPKLVCYNTETGQINYFNINKNIYLTEKNGQVVWGGISKYNDLLLLPSPVDNKVLIVDVNTGKQNIHTVGSEDCTGTGSITFDGQDFWLMPFNGYNVRRWNIQTGDITTYNCQINGIKCRNLMEKEQPLCDERPFLSPAFVDEYVYLSPWWANKFLKLNKNTGELSEFVPNIEIKEQPINVYYKTASRFTFVNKVCENTYMMFSYFDRTLYKINLKENTAQKIEYKFDEQEISCGEDGFKLHEFGDWAYYNCFENAFNSLEDFLNDNITGNKFDKNEQLKANRKISENIDGTCGENIHKAIIEKLTK